MYRVNGFMLQVLKVLKIAKIYLSQEIGWDQHLVV